MISIYTGFSLKCGSVALCHAEKSAAHDREGTIMHMCVRKTDHHKFTQRCLVKLALSVSIVPNSIILEAILGLSTTIKTATGHLLSIHLVLSKKFIVMHYNSVCDIAVPLITLEQDRFRSTMSKRHYFTPLLIILY